MNNVKIPSTQYPVLDLIKNRWSARSFADTPLSQDELNTLVEAASWTFSGGNEQPWRFIVAHKHHPDFERILKCLNPGNAVWAKNAGAFIVSIAKTTFDKEGNPFNQWAEHDLGAANATLILQATSMGLHAHPMAGFNGAELRETFSLAESLKPVVIIALGHLDSAEKLEEPFKTRELTARTRKPLSAIILN